MSSLEESYIQVISFLTYAGAFNGVLLTLVFATYRKGNTQANRYFLVILFVLSLRLIDISLYISAELWRFPFLSGITYPLLFLIGPSFYVYTKKLWDVEYRLHLWHLFLLIPFVWAFWDSSGWIFYDIEQKTEILKSIDPWIQGEITVLEFVKFGFLIAHTAIYLAVVISNLKDYKYSIQNASSDSNELLKFGWLKTLTTGLFIYVSGFFITMVLLATTNKYGLLIDRTWIVALTFFIHAVGFLAIQQPRFFGKEMMVKASENGLGENQIDRSVKYKKSPLEERKAEEYFEELKYLMVEEKLFINHKLKASEIASKLGIPTYQFSHLLSIKSEYNFFDFVNFYRVNEAKALLSKPEYDHLTILAIGMESGFNNKSSFNRAFKKFTGETPSSFKKKLEIT